MKSSSSRWGFLLSLFLVLGAVACTADTEEEDVANGITLQRLRDRDEERAWALYRWYLTMGIEPCDPPPDPWHDFVIYGCCSAEEGVEHEGVPDTSYDD